jgi:hypothetical protein
MDDNNLTSGAKPTTIATRTIAIYKNMHFCNFVETCKVSE